MQGDCTAHNHHLVTLGVERVGGTRQPFMLFPRVGSSRPLVDSASCPQHGIKSALFHCGPISGTARLCLAGTC